MRYESYQHCEGCKRGTPHTKRGACVRCRSALRRATRRAKSSAIGAPLVHHGQLRTVAWDLWSVWLRARALGCQMCGTPLPPDRLQGAHGFTRQERRIMFDLRNLFPLCSSCHRRHSPAGPAWFAWMEERLGAEQFAALKRDAAIGPKLTTDALELLILDARQRIAALPEGERKAWAQERETAILERLVRLGVRAA